MSPTTWLTCSSEAWDDVPMYGRPAGAGELSEPVRNAWLLALTLRRAATTASVASAFPFAAGSERSRYIFVTVYRSASGARAPDARSRRASSIAAISSSRTCWRFATQRRSASVSLGRNTRSVAPDSTSASRQSRTTRSARLASRSSCVAPGRASITSCIFCTRSRARCSFSAMTASTVAAMLPSSSPSMRSGAQKGKSLITTGAALMPCNMASRRSSVHTTNSMFAGDGKTQSSSAAAGWSRSTKALMRDPSSASTGCHTYGRYLMFTMRSCGANESECGSALCVNVCVGGRYGGANGSTISAVAPARRSRTLMKSGREVASRDWSSAPSPAHSTVRPPSRCRAFKSLTAIAGMDDAARRCSTAPSTLFA
mmetsp:Transcript_39549/g.122328  ORF Transcript_39549/g.122328 Transcript_39549/m.122328 type:complete len:371 (+) Transcript_39549:1432-2544(+)